LVSIIQKNVSCSEALTADELSWDALITEEPRLKDLDSGLQDTVRESEGKHRFCANAAFMAGRGSESSIKLRMMKLVGWDAENPKLRSDAAYDLAYDHLYDPLPDCRRCWWTGPLYPAHPEALTGWDATSEALATEEPRFGGWVDEMLVET
jgi:hypothetical protein